jgi:transcriptional regulator with XRE-family HTH domain
MENEENTNALLQEDLLLRKLKKISSLAPYCEKPSEGWIVSLGIALGFDHSQLSQKLNMSIKKIQLLEQKTKVPAGFNRIAKAFGGRLQYIFLPKDIDDLKKRDSADNTPNSLEVWSTMQYPPLPTKPPNGWIQFIRKAQKISRRKLAKKLHISELTVLKIEEHERKNKLFSDRLIEAVCGLGYRLEYLFIPYDNPPWPPSVQAYFPQLAPFFSLSLYPPDGWIYTIREALNISKLQLGERINRTEKEVFCLEKAEWTGRLIQTFNHVPLKEIAQALGCRFEYFLVREPSLFDEKFLMQFYYFPMGSADTKTNRGQIYCLRKALGIYHSDLIKKLDINQNVIRQLEKPDAKGSLFCQHAQDLAQALGCQIHYTFISEKPINEKIRSPLAQLWEEQREYILSYPKPPEGWFRYLRNSLGLSLSEVSKKIGIEEAIIIQAESNEKNDRLIKEPMKKLIQALGLRLEYVIIPYICSKKCDVFVARQDAVKKFRKLSLLPQKPAGGWLKAIRNAWGMSQTELAQYANYHHYNFISFLEATEKSNQIWPIYLSLESILETIDCRAELIFIPEDMNFIQNTFENKKKSIFLKKLKEEEKIALKKLKEQEKIVLKKLKEEKIALRKLKAQKSLKSKELRTLSSRSKHPLFPMQFDQLTLLPKRSPGSCVQMLRKKNGLTLAALAKKMGCRSQEIAKRERAEREKKVLYPPLEKIAHALGCHLNYLFIPNKDSPYYPNLDEDFGKDYELTFQAATQIPPEGWISDLRKTLQLSREDLAKRGGVNVSRIDFFERKEKNNELISPILKKVAQGLNCQVRLMFIPKQAFFDEFLPSYRRHLEKIYSSFRKPPEGWVRFIRTIYQIQQKQLAQAIKASNKQITYLETCEAKNTLVHKDLQKIAYALGGRFEYVFIPNTPLSYSSSKKQLYQAFPIPLKPATGWIKAIRLARGLSVSELAMMAHIPYHQAYQSEKFESQNMFESRYFQKIAEALGGRFEYVLIPDKKPLPRNRSLVPLSAFPIHPQSTDG